MTKVNLSLNGIPGTLWEIRRQENIHWYLGYRQAILIINALDKNLKEASLSQKKSILALNRLKQACLDKSEAESEICALEVEIAEAALSEQQQMIRDAEMERKTAVDEKARIEREHCEIEDNDYESLQNKYALEAFQNKLVRSIAISAYGAHKMLPEGASEIIFDMASFPEEDRLRFSEKVATKLIELMPELVQRNSTFSVNAVSAETFDNNGANDEFIVGRN